MNKRTLNHVIFIREFKQKNPQLFHDNRLMIIESVCISFGNAVGFLCSIAKPCTSSGLEYSQQVTSKHLFMKMKYNIGSLTLFGHAQTASLSSSFVPQTKEVKKKTSYDEVESLHKQFSMKEKWLNLTCVYDFFL